MRELFATELRSVIGTNANARTYVDQWARKHVHDDNGRILSIIENDAGSCIYALEQVDDTDPTLRWRAEVAFGSPDDLAFVTVRIRVGALPGATVGPLNYSFNTPAIVRTLIRELEIVDETIPYSAGLVQEVGASAIDDLVSLLSADRRLPIVVVSRDRSSGSTLLSHAELVRELAGVAHVRVLASTHAAWALTHAVGKELAAWDGGVRVYFPGFATTDDSRTHRLTYPDRVDQGTVGRLRSWLGSLSAATTAEHPAYEEQRSDRRRRMQQAADGSNNAAELSGYVALLEEDNEQQRATAAEERQRAVILDGELASTRYELELIKNSFAEVTLALQSNKQAPDGSLAIDSVSDAMDAVEELARSRFYASRVTVTPAAVESGRKFKQYADPECMLRAVQACHQTSTWLGAVTCALNPSLCPAKISGPLSG